MMEIEVNHVHEMRNGEIKVETYSLTYEETNQVTFVTRMINTSLDSDSNQTQGFTYHYSSLTEATDKFDFLVRRFIDPTHLETSEEADENE